MKSGHPHDGEADPDSHPWRGTRVLVLGASGFVGRWVARLLCRAGADLHLAVRNPGRAVPILGRFGARGTVHQVDLAEESQVSRLLAEAVPAVVFDLASHGVGRAERDERAASLLNARLPQTLAREFRADRHPGWTGLHVVRAGSALEYGQVGGDLREGTQCRPTTLYGRTKLEGTLALAQASRAGALRAVTARLFTVYGPGERPGRLLPSLRLGAQTREPIPLTSGRQKRDFVLVEDAAEALLRLALSPAGPGEVVNVATGRLTSVRDFALAAARILAIEGRALRFGALPDPEDEIEHDPVRIDRLRELCAWSPPDDVDSGIARSLRGPDLEGSER